MTDQAFERRLEQELRSFATQSGRPFDPHAIATSLVARRRRNWLPTSVVRLSWWFRDTRLPRLVLLGALLGAALVGALLMSEAGGPRPAVAPRLASPPPPTPEATLFLGPDPCALLTQAEVGAALGIAAGPAFTDGESVYRATVCYWGVAPDSNGRVLAGVSMQPYDPVIWRGLVGSANASRSRVYVGGTGATYLHSAAIIARLYTTSQPGDPTTLAIAEGRLADLIEARLGGLPTFPPPSPTP